MSRYHFGQASHFGRRLTKEILETPHTCQFGSLESYGTASDGQFESWRVATGYAFYGTAEQSWPAAGRNLAGLPLNGGIFNTNTPGIVVGFRSQSLPDFKKSASLDSKDTTPLT
jgi:hypothetical protein